MPEVLKVQRFNIREESKKVTSNKSKLAIALKSVVLALIISLICIIIYAIVLSITPISDNSMTIVTQIISMLSILAAAAYCGQRVKEKGWLYGLIVGIIYIIVLIPISILWGHTLTIDKYFFAKLLMAALVGLIGGIIGVNII